MNQSGTSSIKLLIFLAITLLFSFNLFAAGNDERVARHEQRIFEPVSNAEIDFNIRTQTSFAADFDNLKISESIASASFIQKYAGIAELADGKSIVVWQDERNGIFSIYGQLYAADGSTLLGNSQLSVSTNGFSLIEPRVVSDASGGFFLAWRVMETAEIYAARFDDDLNPLIVPFLVTTNSSASFAGPFSMDTDGSGRLAVVWEHYNTGSFIGLRIFDVSGTPLSSVITVNEDGGAQSHWVPDIAMTTNGSMMIVWEDYRNGNADIFAQIANIDGSLSGGNIGIIEGTFSSYSQILPVVSFSDRDGYAIGWLDNRGDFQDVYLQRFVPGTNLVGGNIKISESDNTFDNWDVEFKVGSDDNLYAVWSTNENADRIQLQLFTADFAVNGSAIQVNQLNSESRWKPMLGFNSTDNLLIAWTDLRNGLSDIYLQRTTLSGTGLLSTDALINDDADGANSFEADIALINSGLSAVAFTDQRNDVGDVFVQMVDFGGNLIGANSKTNTDPAGLEQKLPKLASNGDKVLIVWHDARSISGIIGGRIFGRYMQSDGSFSGPDFAVSDSSNISGKDDPAVAMASDGRAMAVWTDSRLGTAHIYGRHFDADGNPSGDEIVISTVDVDFDNVQPSIDIDANDIFTIGWVERGNPGEVTINIVRYDGNGVFVNRFGYNANVDEMDMAVNSTGDIYLFWSTLTADEDIYLTVLNNSGVILNSAFGVTGFGGYNPEEPSVSIDNQGVAILTWTDIRLGNRLGYYQYIASNYGRIGPPQAITDFTSGIMAGPCGVGYDITGWMVWTSNQSDGKSIFMRQMTYSTTGVDDNDDVIIPDGFVLNQNYPNPFNPSTSISFSIPERKKVKIYVADVLGRRVTTLTDRIYGPGRHEIHWDGRDSSGKIMPSGLYLYHMNAEGHTVSKKMLLLK